MGKSLVIVESPAKAKTISRILGSDYVVEASYGHIRDLPESADDIPARVKKEPWARLGVNVGADFEPLYVVSKDKKKYIRRLQEALGGASELLLATDEDREGESISWHVVEVLAPTVPVRRIAFHEITDEAIHEALEHPRVIDQNLVRAQESRRILDRLFGYELSPVLWKKVRTGLSAGRVQSVAVRLCVLRERERAAFRDATWWNAEAQFAKDGQHFTARLVRVGDQTVASGQDFDAATGALEQGSSALWLRQREEVERLLSGWPPDWRVTSVEEKPFTRRPAPPFTTSALQQEANRKLRFTARHTMSVAQRLYEGIELGGERVGLITYMRTDSMTLSRKALADAQQLIRQRYGDEFTPGPRQYKTSSKSAQEAHEAIRPTEVSRTPDQVSRFLSRDELALYDLVWRRTVASQMADARLRRTAVEISTGGEDPGVFSARGKTIEFPGFLSAYVEGSDDPQADAADLEIVLPPLAEGEECTPREVTPVSHVTQPPARYTEATLIKRLEKEGIGRPSTYATIIDTIQRRGYVVKQSNALVPTFVACAVTQLLEGHFADYVDTRFTARMEEQLDDIADGTLDWKQHLTDFYFGGGEGSPGLERRIASEEPSIEYPRLEVGPHPGDGKPIQVRVGRYGPYLQHGDEGGDRTSASLPEELAPADLDVETAVALLESAKAGDHQLGQHPETSEPVLLCRGRYGPYVQLGETPTEKGAPKPKRASLPRGVAEDAVTLEDALLWLSLPRTLGVDPGSGDEVIATVGRFGPFVRRGEDTRSLPAEDDVYSVDLDRALEILAQPKGRRRRGTPNVLRELGKDAEGRPIRLLDGRYGPYLSNGEVNASLAKGSDPDALTEERAAEILAERGKPPKRRRKRA